MSRSTFDRIMTGTREAIAHAKGEPGDYVVHIPETVDVKAIRVKMKLTQPEFANTFGFSLGRVRDWEQGRSPVDTPNRAFMTILEKEPIAALRALGMKEGYTILRTMKKPAQAGVARMPAIEQRVPRAAKKSTAKNAGRN